MELKNKRFDIKIDNLQTIMSSVEILKETGKYTGNIACFYRSKMQCLIVSGYQTFEDAGIYTGDVLIAV